MVVAFAQEQPDSVRVEQLQEVVRVDMELPPRFLGTELTRELAMLLILQLTAVFSVPITVLQTDTFVARLDMTMLLTMETS